MAHWQNANEQWQSPQWDASSTDLQKKQCHFIILGSVTSVFFNQTLFSHVFVSDWLIRFFLLMNSSIERYSGTESAAMYVILSGNHTSNVSPLKVLICTSDMPALFLLMCETLFWNFTATLKIFINRYSSLIYSNTTNFSKPAPWIKEKLAFNFYEAHHWPWKKKFRNQSQHKVSVKVFTSVHIDKRYFSTYHIWNKHWMLNKTKKRFLYP